MKKNRKLNKRKTKIRQRFKLQKSIQSQRVEKCAHILGVKWRKCSICGVSYNFQDRNNGLL